jgi:hypothetical protein
VTVKNTFINDGDDNWNSTQPLIGAVHELIIEFHDDILTIFPIIFSWDVCPHTLIWVLGLFNHPKFRLIFTLPHEEIVCLELLRPQAIVF